MSPDRAPDRATAPHGAAPTTLPAAGGTEDAPRLLLETRNLAIGYGRSGKRPQVLLSGIELSLAPGRLVALLGPNGAGKSTLLRSLVGLQPPLSGETFLGGAPLARLAVEERARRAAVVLAERFDPGWFSVGEIVAFGRYPYTDARNRLSDRDRLLVREALDAVGLSGFAGRRFAELSDGERQKALIARGLAQEAPLLVLDEPTAFLDAPARIEIFHLARRLAASGKSVVLSTHDVDLALGNADLLWLIDRDRRFEQGLPEELVLSGSIGRAFDLPGLRFDPASGRFRPEEAPHNRAVFLEGPESPELAWTRRLLERLGFALASDPARADARLSLELSAPSPCEAPALEGLSGPSSAHSPPPQQTRSRGPDRQAAWLLDLGDRPPRGLSRFAELSQALEEFASRPPSA